jgi:hypothetical protein
LGVLTQEREEPEGVYTQSDLEGSYKG